MIAAPARSRGLDIVDLTVRFGGLVAVDRLTMHVEPGEIVGLIGPNGAGKSTVLNAISRFVPATAVTLSVAGHDVQHLPAHRLLALGCARTFQSPQLIPDRSVFANVLLGHHPGLSDFVAALLRTPALRRSEAAGIERTRELLAFCGLESWAQRRVGEIPYGARKAVEIARALVSGPKLLLLDEPVAGITVEEKRDIVALLQSIRGSLGCGLLVVDHDMSFIHGLCDRVYVMDFGELIASGAPAAVFEDQRVIDAYLGPPEPEGSEPA